MSCALNNTRQGKVAENHPKTVFSIFFTFSFLHFVFATLEPSSTDEGNDDYGQVCGAETIVPALSSNEDDTPAQSSGTSSWPKIDHNEQPLITQKLRKRRQEKKNR